MGLSLNPVKKSPFQGTVHIFELQLFLCKINKLMVIPILYIIRDFQLLSKIRKYRFFVAANLIAFILFGSNDRCNNNNNNNKLVKDNCLN